MKVTLDVNKTKGLYEKILGTEPGRFASALDEMLYNGDVIDTNAGKGAFEHKKFCVPVTTYDKHAAQIFNELDDAGKLNQHIESKRILAKLRDFLYQQAMQELVAKSL